LRGDGSKRSGSADLFSQALDAHRAGDLVRARRLYQALLRGQPDHIEALHLLCLLEHQRGRHLAALALVDRVLALRPGFPEALYNRGTILLALGRCTEALAGFDAALAIRADYPQAHHNRGLALAALNRFQEAAASHERALGVAPDFAEAHLGHGNALFALGRFADAVKSFDRALAITPLDPTAHNNRGNALKELGRHAAALASFDRALAIAPGYAEAHNNRGNVLKELGRSTAALASYDQAVAARPDYARAHYNRGNLLYEEGRLEEASAALQRALRLEPSFIEAHALIADLRARICDWSNREADAERLLDAVRNGTGGVPPFMLLSQRSTPADQLRCARQWGKGLAAAAADIFPHRPPTFSRKLRLGYLSADFRHHPLAYSTAEIFERHDRGRFEVFGYSYGPDDGSDLRHRLEQAFDRFVELRPVDVVNAARQIHRDGVDILVDLTGYTTHSRSRILARRPAPIQVSFLGYPGTMGVDFIDYIIADAHIVPADHRPFYSEKVVYLPHCHQPSDTTRPIAADGPSRAQCGLPPEGFVFCCFNASYKLGPIFFDIWMRLLRQVTGSVLWLLEPHPLAIAHLRREAATRGVASERLVFAPRLPTAAHLARHRLADLFLDTLPYNAGTTANDALWAGLPVLTCTGDTYVGRIAGSLLRAAGLGELVTETAADYETLALRLATDQHLLTELRGRLARNRWRTPLFDMARYTRDVEAGYLQMWEIWRAGEAPRPIHIAEPGSLDKFLDDREVHEK
jgi:protein O-GlcNAc transferase